MLKEAINQWTLGSASLAVDGVYPCLVLACDFGRWEYNLRLSASTVPTTVAPSVADVLCGRRRATLISYRRNIIDIVIHVVCLTAELIRHSTLLLLPLINLLQQAIHLDR